MIISGETGFSGRFAEENTTEMRRLFMFINIQENSTTYGPLPFSLSMMNSTVADNDLCRYPLTTSTVTRYYNSIYKISSMRTVFIKY